ncbi:MAG: adenosylcobinamide amidohydrolase [Lamprobacter sp.]|uniref:adenosylcobinamide amidohydrolase n=1 Tax=Lamprobacter sp. TaxID=3100796 RepID=UPI002B25BEEE|nr:adenosylcobinamide amidohydrolase [Lamprobacter sp.]MEA3638610.1 adenosylcobinamide amidohydrolase [Lamprobacter sp.]
MSCESAMLLSETEHYRLLRQGRFLWAALKRPHRVLSTCKVNGGLREDLTHVANHQSCEGIAHHRQSVRNPSAWSGRDAFHMQACVDAGLPPQTTALMSTAANMQCAVLSQAAQEELVVSVAATAGVLGNATRAGDPAAWHEYPEGSRPIQPADADSRVPVKSVLMAPPDEVGSGTIVLLVFINQPCTAACLMRAVTMVTEAKSAALLDLRMPSLQSAGLATGTGTDQLVIAAPLPAPGDWERNWAGGHNSLGELLGRTVHAAVSRCILLQNGVCAELRRSVCGALGRHGCDEAALMAQAEAELEQAEAALFAHNLMALIHDPQAAAAAYAMAEIIDLARAGVLHAEVAREAMINQAALLAAAVAVAPEQFPALREALQSQPDLAPGVLAARAVALGFARKWD